MRYIDSVYAVWLREVKVFLRERERVVSAITTPLLWILIFGAALSPSIRINGMDYQKFIFPGIVSMAVLFGSIFYGLYVIWDRKLDFLKEVLVAPVPRSAVFFGKMLGGSTDVLIQAGVLLLIGIALGMVPSLWAAAAGFGAAFIIALCITSLGLIIGANMKSPEGFNLVMSFIMWPMFMLSGALFPTDNLPSYLAPFVQANPLTYGVDLMRLAILGISSFGFEADMAALLSSTAIFAFIGSQSFEKMQV